MDAMGSGVVPVTNVGGDYGMYGGNFIWALFFFALLGGRGFGWGGNGGWNSATETLSNEFLYTNLNSAIGQGFTQNANNQFQTQKDIWQANSALQMQLAQNGFNAQNCCCETQRAIDNVKFENAQNTCAINANTTNQVRMIYDKLCQMESNNKDQRIADLQLQLQSAQGQLSNLAQTANIINQVRPTPIPAFTVGNPYTTVNYGCFGNGSNCCNYAG